MNTKQLVLNKNQEIAENRTEKFRKAIYEKYHHVCQNCGESLYNGEPVELHHLVSQKQGGK